jgi:hypothetical protein
MKTRIRATVVLGLPAVMACCLLLIPTIAAASAVSPLPESDYTVRPVCGAPAPGYAGCLALELVPKTAAARAHTHPLGITRSALTEAGKAAEICEHPTPGKGCFGLRPQDLHSIYQLPTTTTVASTQTIALVDAYNDLTAEADLNLYSKEFGLSELAACTAGETDECFEQVNQNGETGKPPFPASTKAREAEEAVCKSKAVSKRSQEAKEAACKEVEEADGWSEEISLDIEVSHATCQSCKIVLVEANLALFTDLEEAEKTAARLGATEISNSWGGPEQGVTPRLDDESPFNDPGTVITAAAGDDGYLDWDAEHEEERGFADYPASSPHVVAVGGTRLQSGETWAGETVWNDGGMSEGAPNGYGAGGSGCSVALAAPIWQQSTSDWESVGCGEDRAVADVSADADPYTGIAMYDSTAECKYAEGGALYETHWCTIGGTSLASPLIASVFALAGGAGGVAYPAETLYENEIEHPASLHDITSGSNGSCAAQFDEEDGLSGCTVLQEAADCSEEAICLAREGYDGPTGVGTPNGIAAFEPTDEEVKHKSEKRREETLSARAKLREEERQREAKKKEEEEEEEKEKKEEEKNAANGSGGGSTTGSASGTASPSGTPSNPSSTTTSSISGRPTIKLSAFALTPTALLALNRARPKVSSVGFAFVLSAAARVRATLAKLVRVHGHSRWVSVPGALTFSAAKGRNQRHLTSSDRLASGRYRLTLAPQHGSARSITFRVA